MDHSLERRAFPRFRVKDGTLAIKQTILGPVINLSLGGMAFEYYGNEIEESEQEDIGLYFIDSEFLLTGIRNKIVRDSIIEPNIGIMPIIRKRRSIQFVDLSVEQRQMIKRFINQNATGSI